MSSWRGAARPRGGRVGSERRCRPSGRRGGPATGTRSRHPGGDVKSGFPDGEGSTRAVTTVIAPVAEILVGG